jgi:hypothetical protein
LVKDSLVKTTKPQYTSLHVFQFGVLYISV